ncbi:3-isopropylmalate dehydratase small subunit [Pseudemcibacter aquimaris]|uniref:3-isopropylmalate dehydratase small subunit n=1 Tax=Pseudemcibacter aquimaris TaxID=2857064 RepID=UPI00237EE0BD|nr:3-isopropylmalate dehydratase small subunit [Pseudemcibacter aquimaris]MCC3861969.1 3-isopropylmalate dehydratase small subunit [Pseudemcibacter aquimaris]WDU58721.1 3-isopropylmalate dehydratase small subunit [Pseudemcibacter aquimaris]
MEKFTKIRAVAAPLPMTNVDTDMIIPQNFLRTIERTGLGKHAFTNIRYFDDGSENPEFIMNKPAYRDAKILITGENFGCGSSREHAPWALMDMGLRCIIAPSFADIFYGNCFKNGLLPIKLPQEVIDDLMADADKGANAVFTVDLENLEITRPDGEVVKFEMDGFRQHSMVNGLDDIGITMEKGAKISEFEAKQKAEQPWLYK